MKNLTIDLHIKGIGDNLDLHIIMCKINSGFNITHIANSDGSVYVFNLMKHEHRKSSPNTCPIDPFHLV